MSAKVIGIIVAVVLIIVIIVVVMYRKSFFSKKSSENESDEEEEEVENSSYEEESEYDENEFEEENVTSANGSSYEVDEQEQEEEQVQEEDEQEEDEQEEEDDDFLEDVDFETEIEDVEYQTEMEGLTPINSETSSGVIDNLLEKEGWEISFDMSISDKSGQWRNLFHYGNKDNTRAPAMWIYKNQHWKLHLRMNTTSNWNDGLDFDVPEEFRNPGQSFNVRIRHEG